MKAVSNKTTVTATTLGAAVGAIVAWGLSLINGVNIPVEIAGAITVVCTFLIGLVVTP